MEVRAKKSLGQHFLTDQNIARAIVDSLNSEGVYSKDSSQSKLTYYTLTRNANNSLLEIIEKTNFLI